MKSANNHHPIMQARTRLSSPAYYAVILTVVIALTGCRKLVSISDPASSITTNQVFTSNELALTALNGVYFSMVAGNGSPAQAAQSGSLSSDELTSFPAQNSVTTLINTNHIATLTIFSILQFPTDNIWSGYYGNIYTANAVIDGIAASSSSLLTDSVRRQLTAEAKCLRAYAYFYLTNFYGDVPLLLHADFQSGIVAQRTRQDLVYQQIIQDLKDAANVLPADFSFNGGKRTRFGKWAATALLARAYLYTKDYANAAVAATAVINNTSLFHLETDLDRVFLAGSNEAVWQLNPATQTSSSNATPEGGSNLPINATINTGPVSNFLTPQLLNLFEPGDLRRQQWIDSTTFDYYSNGNFTTKYFCWKYKIGAYNQVAGVAPTEYSMVLRLAELYLIRAEAEANGAPGGLPAAIADLNMIRNRAGLAGLPDTLPPSALPAAIVKERQTELFGEGAHRWFDLKRSGQAHDVLSAISYKQPWAGDYQLLYPIPLKDLQQNRNLSQNPGY